MKKYIKGKDGKFAGSIGVGKSRVPQALRPGTTNNNSVGLSDVARNFDPFGAPIYSENTYLDGIPSVSTEKQDDDCHLMAEEILSKVQLVSPESFRDEIVKKKPFIANGYGDEFSLPLNTGNHFSAKINYMASYGLSYIEVETDDGMAISNDLPQEYTDHILAELKARKILQ
jgi:hypothetical protein